MDSTRAEEHVRRALFEFDNSCPIYRGDNLDIMLSLTPQRRKSFFIHRYRLAKKALKDEIKKDDILSAFHKILTPLSQAKTGTLPNSM
jgi:hypothetical protein